MDCTRTVSGFKTLKVTRYIPLILKDVSADILTAEGGFGSVANVLCRHRDGVYLEKYYCTSRRPEYRFCKIPECTIWQFPPIS